MEGEIRYCASADGTRIAYCLTGDGPALVQCPGLWESIQNAEMEIYAPLWRGRTVVRYDSRGVGLSQRRADDYSIDRIVDDIEAVVASARLDRFALFGSQLSAAAAVLYANRRPDQVVRLILSRPVTRAADVMPRENLEALTGLIAANWEMASQAIADLGGLRGGDPAAGVRVANMLRQNMQPQALAAMLTDLHRTTDIKDALQDIQCPTLILHRRDDSVFPFSAAQHAAATVRDSRLFPLLGDGPPNLGDDGEAAIRAEIAFLDEDPETCALPSAGHTAALPADSAFRAVLFTDLVGHTEMMSRLGDDRGRAVLREHERITREVLKANGGTEVKTMGDGFMASFGSVTKAVECAIALQRAVQEHNQSAGMPPAAPGPVGAPLAAPNEAASSAVSVRVGLNAGEPIEEDGDLFGATVILASRIAAKAEGGEILVADTVRGLCSGKGFLFADRGDFAAKGFEEPVRVYEVSWRT